MICSLIAGTAFAALPPAPMEPEELDISAYVNVASLRATHTFGMDFDQGIGSMDFTNVGAFSLLGQFHAPGGFTYIPALTYDFSHFNLENAPPGLSLAAPDLEDPLHRVDLYNFLIKQTDSGWIYGAMLTPGIHSSFEDLNSRDLFLSAAVAVGYRFSDSLLGGLMVYGSDLTNDPTVLVSPAFLWEINDDWTTFFYGTRFVLRRSFGEDRSIGVEAAYNGGHWSTKFAGQDAQLDFASTRAGLVYRQRLGADVWFDLSAGYTFGNELRFRSAGGRDIITPGLGDASGAPYVRLGLTVGSW
ncbi:DUF6268 family outer membrane beta-barrel protein [Haloferula sargassicola]|uniref:DUF6268 domain-containing protein n=1 Tax=Haloferula sargassicola TaxID=490096 RepID=A0ABP9USE7_9BACT